MADQIDMFQHEMDQRAEAAEFYRSPPAAAHQLLDTASLLKCPDTGRKWRGLPGRDWWDIGAGDGGLWSVMRGERPRVRWHLVDVRREALNAGIRMHGAKNVERVVVGDWRDTDPAGTKDATVVVMNSPFSVTHELLAQTFKLCPSAWVWSLQRTSWLTPRGNRAAWVRAHHPEFVLHATGPRYSFTGDGGTDGCEYDWHGWSPKGRNRKNPRLTLYCISREEAPPREQLALI